MTPETFIVEFWHSGEISQCPRLLVADIFEYDEAAKVCASLRARGYKVEVCKLILVDVPTAPPINRKK